MQAVCRPVSYTHLSRGGFAGLLFCRHPIAFVAVFFGGKLAGTFGAEPFVLSDIGDKISEV